MGIGAAERTTDDALSFCSLTGSAHVSITVNDLLRMLGPAGKRELFEDEGNC